jgi:hypothetical protein
MARTGKVSPNFASPRWCEPKCNTSPQNMTKQGTITIYGREMDLCFCKSCGRKHQFPKGYIPDTYTTVDSTGKEIEK